MTDHSGVPVNAQQQQHPPPRRPRTHLNALVSAALQALPAASKRSKNKEIEARNAERNLQHAKHLAAPNTYADASDVESLITVASNEATSPATRTHKILGLLSPTSARDYIRNHLLGKDKRPREEETVEAPKATKKVREEIVPQSGMSLPVAFHSLLRELYDHEAYLPLSLFTSKNLELISASFATIALRKLNAPGPGLKQPSVLDTEAFEEKVLREEVMGRAQWLEAAANFLTFLESVTGDPESSQCIRWHAHFGFFNSVSNKEVTFPAVRSTDIAMRKRYLSMPFQFSAQYYGQEFTAAVANMQIDEMRDQLAAHTATLPSIYNASTYTIPVPGRGGSSGGAGRGGRGRGGAGGGRGGGPAGGAGVAAAGAPPPFPAGNGGAAPPPACLVCARRGHQWDRYTSTTFEDGRALHVSARGPDLLVVRGGQTLCRSWNAKGPASRCQHEPVLRAHSCSFCGANEHHAFSWSCRRNPLV
ncbi:hypothetical protein C8J57DRAFT_1568460 [Mycena rebaudengoi]|nr:hypothetical protein C8J57DRAFT_1568460 [Mycena rebaudengoi]